MLRNKHPDALADRDRRIAQMISARADGVTTMPIPSADADHPEQVRRYIDLVDMQRIVDSPAGIASALVQRLGCQVANPKLRDAGRGRLSERLPLMLKDLYRYTTGVDYVDSYHAIHLRNAMSTAEAADLFNIAAEASLLDGWDSAEEDDTTGGWVGEHDVPSFKTFSRIAIDETSSLERVPPGAEAPSFTEMHFSKKVEGRLVRYGQMFGADEMDIADDNLAALFDIPQAFGRISRRMRGELVYSLLMSNPTLGDGGALFNSTAITTAGGHANLGSTALGTAGLAAGSAMMRAQLEPSSGRKLNIRPRFLLVPPELEDTGRALLADRVLPDDEGTPQAPLSLRVEPRLSSGCVNPLNDEEAAGSQTGWYLASSPGRTVELNFLLGTARRPVIRSWPMHSGRWGVGHDIKFDVAAVIIDFCGLVKGNS